MNHIQISIEASEEQQELLISELSDLGATGFEQTNTHLLVYFDEEGFPSYEVNEVLEGHNTTVQTIAQQNWNALWESNFQPVIVDDFCAVRAHFHEPVQGMQHEILITPKMSFGTGHHATTWMMMQQMRGIDFNGKQVFDFGTGTGILAILAEKLGAANIDAIDNDEWSIENGIENAERNNCSRINLYLDSSVPGKQYDIILANINRNVILMHLEHLVKAVVPQGLILFSGLLTTDEEVIVKACETHGLKLIKQQSRNNWISLLMQCA
ncbi:[LSU ribosomal protein L11P]-lysine N-methyltransferase [Cnuella takakiae]|uniref:Ribosomal protein L11 methyltransferase n=1 Tax=Cnuella takakiae TaxID=1302690 RepID=A0A1M4VN23_9BACT|nr:50S ribosomal protein L11 methyltransferase [Cnuella takakiae]OLY92545.1 ribosomal protein L11 methyltransferase [Cnuella takakiae]SHE70471.1 [LSU ribosomal protein L11P]-lysine N-methyltransferase [Cnuella takakiae]